ncbi:MAG: alanine racemase [Labilithrix sp.]
MTDEALLVTLEAAAERLGTPTLVFDEPALEARFRALALALGVDRLLYAVKCNPDPGLLATLVRLGAHFEIVADSELDALLGLGCDPSRIIFAHPIRRASDLVRARARGITTFVVDERAAYEMLAANVPDHRCLLRVRGSAGSARYGLTAEEARALLEAFPALRARAVGVCMHHGPFDEVKHVEAFRAGIEACQEVCRVPGVEWRILDVGGGFPDATSNDDPIFAACHEAIASAKRQWASRLEVWAEPGRALAAPAFHLVMSVLSRRIRDDVVHYYVDDSVYGSYLDAATCGRRYDFITTRHQPTKPSVIYGATCDSVDVIARSIELPLLEVGDRIYCPNAGAYTTALTNGFNGIRRPVATAIAEWRKT